MAPRKLAIRPTPASPTFVEIWQRITAPSPEATWRGRSRMDVTEVGRQVMERFKAEALAAVGLASHPKADRAFELACERGGNLKEIFEELQRIADLLMN